MRPRRALAVAVLAAALLAVALVVAACGSDGGASAASPSFIGNDTCPTAGTSPYPAPSVNSSPAVGQLIPEMPHTHVAPGTKVQYNHNPPTSGCHYSIASQAPVPPGAYNQQVPAEYWVHNLEHGYIVVLYNCPAGCASDFQKLVSWMQQQKPDTNVGYTKIVVMPWTSMQPKFAVVSWDYYDPMNTLNLDELQKFYDNHQGNAPEGPMTG